MSSIYRRIPIACSIPLVLANCGSAVATRSRSSGGSRDGVEESVDAYCRNMERCSGSAFEQDYLSVDDCVQQISTDVRNRADNSRNRADCIRILTALYSCAGDIDSCEDFYDYDSYCGDEWEAVDAGSCGVPQRYDY